MGGNIYGYLGMGFSIVVVVVGMISYITTMQQKHKTRQMQIQNGGDIAREEHYRKLAETVVLQQKQIQEGQEKLHGEIAEIRGRLTSIEKLLRDVE
ncbi:hypothetical protein D7Z26_17960 [Cohnella endophytica]|uniref:Uncharacterized protein n=1 Tax=Cohnella endophytica TaxID=2419778 RepID=A0A494XS35_9BACL|nr:hypothetical protein [Cohnella endophytica]RKP51656.1 hypothetical protein D7Z26_17960 [Cohnella endophytica]